MLRRTRCTRSSTGDANIVSGVVSKTLTLKMGPCDNYAMVDKDGWRLSTDPTEKLEALNATSAPNLRAGRFRPPDKLLAMLSGR